MRKIPIDQRTLESLRRGIEQAASRELVDLGSFAKYVEN